LEIGRFSISRRKSVADNQLPVFLSLRATHETRFFNPKFRIPENGANCGRTRTFRRAINQCGLSKSGSAATGRTISAFAPAAHRGAHSSRACERMNTVADWLNDSTRKFGHLGMEQSFVPPRRGEI
jgi:hypothetical protein